MGKMRSKTTAKRWKSVNLPVELITEIFSWLPAKSLFRFKCLSQEWYDQIRNSEFIRLREKRSLGANADGSIILFLGQYSRFPYTFNFRGQSDPHATKLPALPDVVFSPDDLVGSCNGLVCFKSGRYFIYNPATGVYKKVKKVPRYDDPIPVVYSSATEHYFAYDSIHDDYMVFRCVIYPGGAGSLLYSLKQDSWFDVPNPPWKETCSRDKSAPRSVVISNFIHWITLSCVSKHIRRFDLYERAYDNILLPNVYVGLPSLSVLRGQLHIITQSFDIWVMKEYGVAESWTRLFSPSHPNPVKGIPMPCRSRLSLDTCSEDGRMLLVRKEKKHFICVDLEKRTAKDFKIVGLPVDMDRCEVLAGPWVASMASP